MSEMDAIGRLPIAAKLPPGISVSKYFRDLDNQKFELNVEEKEEYHVVNDDPIFRGIASECAAISIADLVVRRNELAAVLEDSGDEEEDGELDDIEAGDNDVHETEQYPETPNSLRSEEPEYNSPDTSRQIEEPETIEERRAREQEEALAALGVTGSPKPVQPSVLRSVAIADPPKDFVPPARQQSLDQSPRRSYDIK